VAITAVAIGCGSGSSEPKKDGPPERIITLTPTSTELIAALGAGDKLVGVDSYSTYPEQVKALPKVGSFLKPDFEAILRLRPDLVVMDDVQAKAKPRLEAAGIRVVMMKVHTISDVKAGLRTLARALGQPNLAAPVIHSLRRQIDAASERARKRKGPAPKVLLVVEREPGRVGRLVVAGPGSYLDELIAILGAHNVMAASGIRYGNVSKEQVLVGKPDVILETKMSQRGANAIEDWSELSMVPAVANRRIHYLEGAYYIAPGPRVGLALRGLEKLLYPRAMKAP
jgi:iron complex transport system substrate-binding protein